MVACAGGSVKLVLDQAALALGASHGASKNPERKGKQHREKAEQDDQRLRDVAQAVSLDQDLPDALETVGGWKNERDAAECWASVLAQELSGEEDARKESRAGAEENTKRIAAFEDHREARGEYSQTREHDSRE